MTNAPENIVRMKTGKIVTHYTLAQPPLPWVKLLAECHLVCRVERPPLSLPLKRSRSEWQSPILMEL